jgi:putative endonuclease
MAAKDELGRRGEHLAAEYLQALGFAIIDRNWRCTDGEIDLVARDGDETVFVEVKTRAGLGFGHPFEAITARKLARLRRLASQWCRAHPDVTGLVRIDAVAVVAPRGEGPTIEHLSRIF